MGYAWACSTSAVMAKAVLKKLGSLKTVLEAEPTGLKEIKGIGDKNILGLKIALPKPYREGI